jgi:hypothetical protein
VYLWSRNDAAYGVLEICCDGKCTLQSTYKSVFYCPVVVFSFWLSAFYTSNNSQTSKTHPSCLTTTTTSTVATTMMSTAVLYVPLLHLLSSTELPTKLCEPIISAINTPLLPCQLPLSSKPLYLIALSAGSPRWSQ